MKWLVLAVLIFAQQPAKAPKSSGAAESKKANSASSTQKTDKNQQQPAQAEAESHNDAAAARNQTATGSQKVSEEDRATQRKLIWFTGVLAGVGVLQLLVMFLTWLVYRRQATIMTRQTETTRDTERAWVIANPVENAPV